MLIQITSMQQCTPTVKTITPSRRAQAGEERERKFEVICKVRPLQQAETSHDISIGEDTPTITIFNHTRNNSKEFTFHRVYGDTTRQTTFSNNLVDEVLLNCRQNGRGCLVLSYGVTNSGKTFTIFGNASQPGILPVMLAKLNPTPVRLRGVEIYNDVIYCLRTGREVQWSDSRGVEECGSIQVTNIAQGESVLGEMMRRRKTDETHSNQVSSRSHAVFMVEWQGYHVAITDLAGNEKYGSNSNFSQTVKINENLLVLGQCIHAFRDGEFIPYRRSKLTQVLMEYFKPSYKIYMIAHLNRSGQMFHQNVNVLEYAAVSTQIRHFQPNPKNNPSFAKSARRRQRQPQEQLPSPKIDPRETERKQNLFLLENYKCFIVGVNTLADFGIDEYFRKEDQKDRQFLEDLKKMKYVSPEKKQKMKEEKDKAQSRIKLREILIQELKRERFENQLQCGTSMGDSILKLQDNRLRSPSIHQPPEERVILNHNQEVPFLSRESAIIANKDIDPPQEQQNQDSTLPFFHQPQNPPSPRNSNIILTESNLLENSKQPEESHLLDGIRSDKDLSTNRTSQVEMLLRSSSSGNNQMQQFEPIPEVVQSETISKPNQLDRETITAGKPEVITVLIDKMNETGVKSTQQTFLQRTHSNSKVTKSISVHKRSNKHHHCHSKSKSSRAESKETIIHCRKYIHVTSSISGIKTRHQRKLKSVEPKFPKYKELPEVKPKRGKK